MRRTGLVRRAARLAGWFLLLLAVGAAVAAWVSRDVRYVVRAGWEEAGILWRRRPIADVVADPSVDAAVRGRLSLVLAARDFAADSLGLAAGRSFTAYSTVPRDTLVLVLSASRSDRLAAKTWTYPVVGRVPYKGFFSFDNALREAHELEQSGMDTYLRVSGAFSTLGWFNDPLLSTVMDADSVELAAMVIHELLHNTLFVPGQVPFNESLANFVGYRGAEAFFRARGEERLAGRAAARWRDEQRMARYYADLAAQLEALYAPGIGGAALREDRQRVFRQALDRLAGPVGRTLETIDGARLAQRPVNNAVVIAQRIYRTRLDLFERLYGLRHGNVRDCIAAVREAVRGAADPWEAVAALR